VATASVTYTFTALTKAQAAQVNTNFQNLVTFLNGSTVHADGAVSMTGALTLPNSDPTNANHATRKSYVDGLHTNSAQGVEGRAAITSGQTFTTLADVTGLSVTFTAAASRLYKITVAGLLRSSVAGDVAQLLIADGSNTTLAVSQVVCAATNFAFTATTSIIQAPSAGSVTYKARCVRSDGSGTVTLDAAATYPAVIFVEDVGAA
jgi:hypothetical protein